MRLFAFVLLTLCVTGSGTFSQSREAIRKQNFNLANSVALEGYDAVSYFMASRPLKGTKEFSYTVDGITYQFASASSRDLFKLNPAKYEPQYGGWCAFAMGDNGEKVEVDPETFKIIDGKLYLFYNSFFNNTLSSWNKNEKALKQRADIHWTHINK